MNTQEAGILLLKLGQYDAIQYPADPADQLRKAAVWAEALEDVPLSFAMGHATNHYRHGNKHLSVADLHNGYINRDGDDVDKFVSCNPVIVSPKHDAEGRYEVWCRRCLSAVHATTYEAAVIVQAGHEPRPEAHLAPRLDSPPPDLTDRSRTCPVCHAKAGAVCQRENMPPEFASLNHIERNPVSAEKARQHADWEAKVERGERARCQCCGADVDPAGAYWSELGKRRPPEITVACPWCKAVPFELCRIKGTGGPMEEWHPARTNAAAEAAPGLPEDAVDWSEPKARRATVVAPRAGQ